MPAIYVTANGAYPSEIALWRAERIGPDSDQVDAIEAPAFATLDAIEAPAFATLDGTFYFDQGEARTAFERFGGELATWRLTPDGRRYEITASIVTPWSEAYWAQFPAGARRAYLAVCAEAMHEDSASVPAPARMMLTGTL